MKLVNHTYDWRQKLCESTWNFDGKTCEITSTNLFLVVFSYLEPLCIMDSSNFLLNSSIFSSTTSLSNRRLFYCYPYFCLIFFQAYSKKCIQILWMCILFDLVIRNKDIKPKVEGTHFCNYANLLKKNTTNCHRMLLYGGSWNNIFINFHSRYLS